MIRRLGPLLLLCGLLTTAPAGASGGGAAQTQIGVTPTIGVVTFERFGLDTDEDGLIDLPNTPEYVHGRPFGSCTGDCGTARFPILLDGSGSIVGTRAAELTGLPLLRYSWLVHGPELSEPIEAGGSMVILRLPEGTHWVELTVAVILPWGRVRFETGRSLEVDDLLVVAMGDSYASGEGNPEIEQSRNGGVPHWADGVNDRAVESAHAETHRSTVAWPARVALALETADPSTTVTFVSVASTSARVGNGLLTPQSDGPDTSQLDQVAAMVGEREIDVLLMSIGGNDIGFSRIVRGLVDADPLFDPICYSTDLGNIWAAARDGDWGRDSALRPGLPFGLECAAVTTNGARFPGLDGLPAELDRLADAIDHELRVETVVVTEYPDPTGRQRTGDETICGEIVGDIFPRFRFLEIDRSEQLEGLERIIHPLNAEVAAAAGRHGWIYVGGVARAFAEGHGYCADPPSYPPGGDGTPDGAVSWYRNPGPATPVVDLADRVTSWFRTAGQSSLLQGPASRYDTEGTLHPNELGHAVIADLVLQALR